MGLLQELKRRNVIRMAGLYLVGAWIIVQVASTLLPVFEAPTWVMKVLVGLLAVGFVAALIFSWVFELTPEGLKRDAEVPPERSVGHVTARRMDRIIIALLVVALGYFALDKFVLAPKRAGEPAVAAAGGGGMRKLAVLPFASLSQDPDAAGMAGGLHDTLITQLSKLKGLEVRSRTSVMKYKDWNQGLKPIAAELGVNVVLEGTVQHQGKRTVVNAQLIDALTDAHLWAETFDRTGDDLFALQADVAQRVAQSLEVALSPRERDALTRAPTENKQAYALFLQAQHVLDEAMTKPYAAREAGREQGTDLLEKAVAADPNFALAWAVLSRAYATIAWDSRRNDYRETSDKARKAAERAAALGADLPEAHFASGTVALQIDFDFARAVRELELAVQGAPGNPMFHQQLGLAYRFLGRFEDAERAVRRSHELDPTDLSRAGWLLSSLIVLGRDDEARAMAREQAALRPDLYNSVSGPAHIETVLRGDMEPLAKFVRATGDRFRSEPTSTEDRWTILVAEGSYAEALAVLEQAPPEARMDGHDGYRGETLLRLGREAEARAAFTTALEGVLSQSGQQRDPYIDASLGAIGAFLEARLGDAHAARAALARSATLWGIQREPVEGAKLWQELAAVHAALGEHEAACAKLRDVLDRRTVVRAGRVWTSYDLSGMHPVPCFRDLMQRHGIDVSKEPFAFNRAPPKAGG